MLHEIHQITVALLILTALLLLIVEANRSRKIGLIAGALSFCTVSIAVYLMLTNVRGAARPWGDVIARSVASGAGESYGARGLGRRSDETRGRHRTAGGDDVPAAAASSAGSGDAEPAGGDDVSAAAADDADPFADGPLERAGRHVQQFLHRVGIANSDTAALHRIADCPECPTLVQVPPGEVRLGQGEAGSVGRYADASERSVRIWPGFAIAKSEITEAEFAAAGLAPPRREACTEKSGPAGIRAAACLTFSDAMRYVEWLKWRTGRVYRLPTAVEWEFSARSNIKLDLGIEGMPGGLAEFVGDCWRERPRGVFASTVGLGRACSKRTIMDAADAEDPRLWTLTGRRPLGPLEASPLIGFRVVRDIDHRADARF